MAVKKLLLDDFFEEEQYILIGIHCTLEDYRLAFLINQVLDIRLKRKQEDVKFSKDNSSFSLYEFNQEKQHIIYYLVANSCKVKPANHSEKHTERFGILKPVLFSEKEHSRSNQHDIKQHHRRH